MVSACLPESLSFEKDSKLSSKPSTRKLGIRPIRHAIRARFFISGRLPIISIQKLLFIAEGYAALRFARPPVQRVRDLVFSAPPSTSKQSSYWRIGVMAIFALVTQLQYSTPLNILLFFPSTSHAANPHIASIIAMSTAYVILRAPWSPNSLCSRPLKKSLCP